MSKEFPLLHSLGLTVCDYPATGTYWISASIAERLLEAAPVVSISHSEYGMNVFAGESPSATHIAMLIGVKPIERDTAEGLLSKLKNNTPYNGYKLTSFEIEEAIQLLLEERARKLLEGK